MTVATLEGVTAKTITTDRIKTRVLFFGPENGIPVLFLHGNICSATWWEEAMVAIPDGFRGIAPDQRGFGDADHEKKIDATRGMGDLADDAMALMDELDIEKFHVAGFSLGGMVVWRLLMDCPDRIFTATLINPGSPFGFGGTKDEIGTPCMNDYSGSGGGLSNPELIQRIKDGDRSTDSPFSPRNAIRTLLVKPPAILPREEELLSSLLSSHIGDQDVPGDSVASPNWPYVAPGNWGASNATSPKYHRDVDRLFEAEPKIHILWARGSHDLAVSNTAASDPGYLGLLGLIPGSPGKEIYPPQPMLDQTRAVLDKYAGLGGSYEEVILQDAGHTAWLEKPDEFNAAFHKHITEHD